MNNVCAFCGNRNFREKTTQYVYKHDDQYLIVNSVPCEECEYCGEQYFAAAVLKQIESDFNAIHISGKKPSKQLQVPVEEFTDLSV